MAARDSSVFSVTMPSDRELKVTRFFDAPRRLVFEAWTQPQHLPNWMLGPEGWTMPTCEVELRSGGEWHFLWRKQNGAEMEMRGVYREVAPYERIVTTESWGADWPDTLNTLVLSEQDGKTTVTLTILYASPEVRDKALQTGMRQGMALSFERLATYLRSIG